MNCFAKFNILSNHHNCKYCGALFFSIGCILMLLPLIRLDKEFIIVGLGFVFASPFIYWGVPDNES